MVFAMGHLMANQTIDARMTIVAPVIQLNDAVGYPTNPSTSIITWATPMIEPPMIFIKRLAWPFKTKVSKVKTIMPNKYDARSLLLSTDTSVAPSLTRIFSLTTKVRLNGMFMDTFPRPDIAAGIFFVVFYLIVSMGIEYIFKPKLVGQRVKMHPLLVFFAIIGGLRLFGILGIIYGPLIVTAFLTLAEIYRSSYQQMVETKEIQEHSG